MSDRTGEQVAATPEPRRDLASRRLSLAGLPRGVGAAAGVGLATTAISAGVAVSVSLDAAVPPASSAASDVGGAVATWALISAAVAASLIVAAAVSSTWRLRRGLLVLPAVVGAFLCAFISLMQVHGALSGGRAALRGMAFVQAPLVFGLIAGVVLATAPWPWLAARPWRSAGLAGVPFLMAVTTVAGSVVSRPELSPASARGALGLVAVVLAAPLSVWGLWLAVEGARLTRDVAVWAVNRAGAVRLLVGFLAVKSILLAAGYANVWFAVVEDVIAGWENSAPSEDVVDWALAALFAVAALTLVARAGRFRIRERPMTAAGLLAVGLFCLPFVLAALATLLLITVAYIDAFWALGVGVGVLTAAMLVTALRRGRRGPLLGLAAAAGGVTACVVISLATLVRRPATVHIDVSLSAVFFAAAIVAMAAVIPACVVAGAVLLRRGARSAGLFLVLFGLWASPRAVGVVVAPEAKRVVGTIDPVAFDTALTVAAAIAFLLWWRGSSLGVKPEALLVLLSVVTAAVVVPLLIPAPVARFFALGLVVPTAVQFLLDARRLNEPHPDRPARVLAAVGLACAALTFSMLLIAGDLLHSDAVVVTRLAPVLFAVPFAFPLVMATTVRS